MIAPIPIPYEVFPRRADKKYPRDRIPAFHTAKVLVWNNQYSLTAAKYLSGPLVIASIGKNHDATANPRMKPAIRTCFQWNRQIQNSQSGRRNISTSCLIPPVIPRTTDET